MTITRRPTWHLAATWRPVVGALLVALAACGTPAATTRGPVGDAPGALAPTAGSYQVRDAAVPPFAAIGDEIPASAYALAPAAPVVLGGGRAAAAPAFATSGDDVLERAPSAIIAARECATPSTCAER